MRGVQLAAVAMVAMFVAAVAAGEPPCPPGYRWAEEESYTEVVRFVCKTVPDVKKVKKVVYSTKDDPFCLPAVGLAGLFHHAKPDGGDCPTCRGSFNRKILVKTEITCEEPTTKCVVEKVIELVPCRVKRLVPVVAP